MSKERNTKSVRYTGTNFVIVVVGTINLDVKGLVDALVVERLVFLVVEPNEFDDVPVVE